MTEYHEPRSLEEACELAHRYGDAGKLLAGGTALVLFMRQGLLNPGCLINIQHVPELMGIAEDGGEPGGGRGVRVGALTTHTQASISRPIKDRYPALAETFGHVATPRIRNAGTIGGNLAHGDPHLDPPVTLLALDARVGAQSTKGRREIPLSELFRNYYETSLAPDEVLAYLLLPPPVTHSGEAFIKFLPRSRDDYATVDIAAWVRLEPAVPGKLQDVRIALGSVGPVPFRATRAEALLRGETVDDDALAEAGEQAAGACDPEDDVRGSAAYKREIVKVLVRRAIRRAMEDATTRLGENS